MFSLELDLKTFTSDWQNCSKISDYLATIASQERNDSLRLGNIYSSALNELLEVGFSASGLEGILRCRIGRNGGTDRIAIDFPVKEEYRERLLALFNFEGDASSEYLGGLSDCGPDEYGARIFSLKTIFEATLSSTERKPGIVSVTAEFPFERMLS